MNLEQQIDVLAEAILSSREFCGNEREAAVDAAADNGIKLTRNLFYSAFERANNIWSKYQCEAGVTNPISFEERLTITRILEKAQ